MKYETLNISYHEGGRQRELVEKCTSGWVMAGSAGETEKLNAALIRFRLSSFQCWYTSLQAVTQITKKILAKLVSLYSCLSFH